MKHSLEKNKMTKVLEIFRGGWGVVGTEAYSIGPGGSEGVQEQNLNCMFSSAFFFDSKITHTKKC